MRKIVSAAVAALALTVSAPVTAAVTLQVDAANKLIGATGVNIGGTLYDVAFVDGTCASVFGVCDSAHFQFHTEAEILAAGGALLSQVLTGSYTNDPTLTRGCGRADECDFFIPASVSGTTIAFGGALNKPGTAFDSAFFGSTMNTSPDLSISTLSTWARFSPHVEAAVPEPATWAMMLLGFGGIGFQIRRKRTPNANHLSQLA